MPNLDNVSVGMQCSGGTILATEATGAVDNNEKVTVTSPNWKMNPTASDGRDYYVIEFGTGRSWKCNCTAFEGNSATFSVVQTNPC